MKKAFAVLVSLCLLGGCAQPAQSAAAASQQQSSGSSDASSKAVQKEEREIISGRVTAVEGSTVTLAVLPGGGKQGERGGKPSGEAPKKDRKDAGSGTESAEVPESLPADPASESEQDSSGSKQKKPHTDEDARPEARQTEEKTITIPDDCTITVLKKDSESDGSISDISVGSMLRVTFAEDGQTVRAVAISDAPQEWEGRAKMPPDDKEAKNASAAGAESGTADAESSASDSAAASE